MEVGDDVIGFVQGAIDARVFSSTTPVTPPTVKTKMKPIAHNIGARSEIEPPHIVAIQEKIFTPVGTAITIVAKTK